MMRRQTAQAQVLTVKQAATVDVTPRVMRGLMLAAALSVPLWGGIALVVHGLWNLAR